MSFNPSEFLMAPLRESAFPLEIYEEIMGLVSPFSSRGTLLSCALTCRAWVPQSQRCLYRSIHLRVKTEPSHGFMKLLQLVETLRNNVVLWDMVRELALEEEVRPDVRAGVLNLGSILVAGTWHRLRSLTVGAYWVSRLTNALGKTYPLPLAFHRSSFAALGNLPALVTLQINHAPLVFVDFCKLLSGFRSLRILILDHVEWRNIQPPAHGWPINRLPHLEHLIVTRLGNCDHERQDFVNFNTIHPHWVLPFAVGDTLKTLTLSIDDFWVWLTDLYISREVQFPRLDSLLISFWYDSPEGDEARGLLKFLQVVSVPRVSTVRIAGRLTRTSIMSDASGLAGMISLGTQVEHHARGIRTLRSLQMMFFAYVDRPGTSPKRDAADAKLASAESLISSVSSRLPHLELEQWFASSPLYWFGVFQFKIVVKEYQYNDSHEAQSSIVSFLKYQVDVQSLDGARRVARPIPRSQRWPLNTLESYLDYLHRLLNL